ncbi:MAG: DUF2089 domain-containing protein [Bacillota bacterium]
MNEALGKCPVCKQNLEVTKLHCNHCNTTIEGSFTLCRFCRLTAEQQQFIETFIKCRGNIKEVEKDLGISYPTVRSRLDEGIIALGYLRKSLKNDDRKREILDMLGRDEIDYQEALKLLNRRLTKMIGL